MKLLRDLFSYTVELLKTYFIFIGLVPWFYDLTSAYLVAGWADYRLPTWFTYGFLILALFASGFRVWASQRRRVKELETGVQYEVSFQVDEIKLIDVEKARKELKYRKGIVKQAGNPSYLIANAKYQIMDFEEYIKKAEVHNSLAEEVRIANIELRNVGVEYDEKINVKIVPKKGTKVLRGSAYTVLTSDLELPKSNQTLESYSRYLAPIASASLMSHKEPFRQEVEFSQNYIEIELRDIRPSEIVDVLHDGIYVDGLYFAFDITVTSKNLKQPFKTSISNKD